MSKLERPKKKRFNMRIPQKLLTWAKYHASRRGTSVTQLIISHLTQLQELDNASNGKATSDTR